MTLPTEQWAQVLEVRGGPLVYKKVPVQQPGPDEVLVNVKFSGVCHTDLHAADGDWPFPTKIPLIGGHEGAGLVVAVGAQVTDVAVGDAVGIKWINGSCLSCSFCLAGEEQLCAKARLMLSGYSCDGTFQQYAVAKAAHLARLPAGADLAAVAPVLCAGITVYKGLKESGARAGQWVAIVGAGGGLGCMALQYARAMGLHAIAIDGGVEKGETCRRLGAATYVDFAAAGEDLVARVRAATPDGLGPQAVLVVAAAQQAFHDALKYVRPRGTIVCIGLPSGAFVRAECLDMVLNLITIKGSYVGNRMDTVEALDFWQRGLIDVPIKTVGLSELAGVFELMRAAQVVGRYVVDTSK